MSTKLSLAKKYYGSEKNVWVEMSKLAVDYNVVNLGQGFPDFKPPASATDALIEAASNKNHLLHQYTRGFGQSRLVDVLSKVYSPIMGRTIDPFKEILISVGGYGALYSCINGFLNPGDEVIIIEPFFDCYEPMVRTAGGIPVFVPLRIKDSASDGKMSSAQWKLDEKEFASKFTENTKLLILNTPSNPVGKVFSRSELEMIAALCIKHDVLCISDEVYEWLTYDGNKHLKIATIPGMWERTLTVGSAGKTFCATGWKTGWTIGPAELITSAMVVHQNSVYHVPTITQEAVAIAFEKELQHLNTPKSYFQSLPLEITRKRDALADVLLDLGMQPTIPEGGFFMLADISSLGITIPEDGTDDPKDFKFVRWLIKEKRFAAIPPSAFYSFDHKHLGEKYIRLCFMKEDETLEAAIKILKEWKQTLKH
ncbi:kynurenine--oxoglutarate transaminase 3 isoform X2 [Octopus bimaculoides]|uniref:Aminotransferase class I/classII large domain-containing protein n=2 Tax=Octopus bimaculoides TaxID=37653 RepID=A0A0L8GHN2_OCTBM|nr:kynurenine--oxoglutarate transaminase 3 isoform X2 [Octopus bimaculoides]XP_052833495.1 kynurenine--oxoglutarate transaminase 3 isoform X2 [Octopus bimaculoides]XP_052833499.1 kynurenine--oxoglutarate transaminase 3 isoform X2 [Octopus bimaculoides]XP_052833505.1 kynurenine--oxoglutarate transaminase 3 isoform X2 [Octopus bimaculoides]XP_052833511.1 kynurenine--oxoglutarate transaminase 3 isoform X2 [Octopus bimaculoides]XP_052833517.1 kynurenine--oxoglutarate transaminase 3 isoform X2 [Oct|eukprot:XP_014781263.1 PREDICTED: kynurenine--oxoglutarate transaminase 3-like isoform X1 [Octopus bimaculoides]